METDSLCYAISLFIFDFAKISIEYAILCSFVCVLFLIQPKNIVSSIVVLPQRGHSEGNPALPMSMRIADGPATAIPGVFPGAKGGCCHISLYFRQQLFVCVFAVCIARSAIRRLFDGKL